MSPTTVIIKTIGRDTLKNSIESALGEGLPVIVVFDGPSDQEDKLPSYDEQDVRFVTLGRRWGSFGNMAANVGAALATTEYITFLDDDDEFVPGAGDVIKEKIQGDASVDIWVGGVRFSTPVMMSTGEGPPKKTYELAVNSKGGVFPGNVAMPTYRTELIGTKPFMPLVQPGQEDYTDFMHVSICHSAGAKVDWFGEALYLVRPRLQGTNGRGK
jgi:glycosyltransferase involved in cell wall biosynthesis